jgi:hypothetical protein
MLGIRIRRARRQSVRGNSRVQIRPRFEELEPRALLAASPLAALLTPNAGTSPASNLTAVLGQPALGQALTAVPGSGAPLAVLGPVIGPAQVSVVRPDLISFSQLAFPGSQASPMAQLPPVPFPYITGPAAPPPGPANAIPTFVVDVARVNQGVGGVGLSPTAESGPAPQGNPPPQANSQPRGLPIPPVLFKPAEEGQGAGTEEPPMSSVPDAPPSAETSWEAVSTAYFTAEAQEAPARMDLPALPLSLDQAASPDVSAVMGLVAVLGGAFWWHPGYSERETQAKRRRTLPVWATPI